MRTRKCGRNGITKICAIWGASQAPNGSWFSDHSAAYSTSAALLSLALNYRFLPIYEQ